MWRAVIRVRRIRGWRNFCRIRRTSGDRKSEPTRRGQLHIRTHKLQRHTAAPRIRKRLHIQSGSRLATLSVACLRGSRKTEAAAEVDGGSDSSLPAEQKRARAMQGKRKKQRACDKFVTTGACKFGDRCKFSHDVTEAAQQRAGGDGRNGNGGAQTGNGGNEDGEQEMENKGDRGTQAADIGNAAMAVQ